MFILRLDHQEFITPPSPPAEAVVLIHGLWMRGIVFALLRHRLRRRGYAVRLFSYPTLRGSLAANARLLAQQVAACPQGRVHLVGHSLGGLVALWLLQTAPDPRIRRVVLLGSPCNGSHCAQALLRSRLLARLVGLSLRQWLPPRPGQRLGAGAAPVEIGVLAGTRSLGLGRLIPGLPRPNDGVVALAETRLAGATDAIALPVSHAQMLLSAACAEQVAAFLQTGKFIHGDAPA